MRKIWGVFASIIIILFSVFVGPLRAQENVAPMVTPELLKQGETLYKKQCAVCHGIEGRGDGPAADFLFPKPRNFTTAAFKFRSTPSGSPPTDQNLFRTLTRGLPGSAMPAFSFLAEKERWALVGVVKQLANITEKPERIISVPPSPPVTPKLLEQGKEAYLKMKCWECHGLEGRGDGPKATDQVDDWGYPAPPADYTRGVFKGGAEPSEIYLRFTTGVDGSPMPSFEDSLNDEERWALTHYVLSFIRPGGGIAVQPSTGTIVAKKVSGAVPKDALDPQWNKAQGVTIPMMRLWQGMDVKTAEALKPHWQRPGVFVDSAMERPEVPISVVPVDAPLAEVSVKAVHNGSVIALLLEWEDWVVNASFLRHQDFTDSAAIMFSLSPEPPHFTMGEKGGTVNIWYWRLDRQMDLAGFQDIEKFYPSMSVDDYQFEMTRYPKSVDTVSSMTGAEIHLPITSAPSHDPVFLTGWGAGNPMSNPMRPSAAEDLNAEGFGTLTAQAREDQDVRGQGIYMAGRWRVVLTRDITTKGPFDAKLKTGGQLPIAFAIWDGARGDRDGQKAVTTWYSLKME